MACFNRIANRFSYESSMIKPALALIISVITEAPAGQAVPEFQLLLIVSAIKLCSYMHIPAYM